MHPRVICPFLVLSPFWISRTQALVQETLHVGRQNPASTTDKVSFQFEVSNVTRNDALLHPSIRHFLNRHEAVKGFNIVLTQGQLAQSSELDFPAHTNTLEVFISNNGGTTSENLRDIMDHGSALADSILGTSFSAVTGVRKFSTDANDHPIIMFKEVPLDRICSENLWKLYSIFPCKSFAGLTAALRPEILSAAPAKRIEVRVQMDPQQEGITMRVRVEFRRPNQETNPIQQFKLNSLYPCPLSDMIQISQIVGETKEFLFVNIPHSTATRIPLNESLGMLWLENKLNGSLPRDREKEPGRFKLVSGELFAETNMFTESTFMIEVQSVSPVTSPIPLRLVQHFPRKIRVVHWPEAQVNCFTLGSGSFRKVPMRSRLSLLEEDESDQAESERQEWRLEVDFDFSGDECKLSLKIKKNSPRLDEMTSTWNFGMFIPSPYVNLREDRIPNIFPTRFQAVNGIFTPSPYITSIYFVQVMAMSLLSVLMSFSRSTRSALLGMT